MFTVSLTHNSEPKRPIIAQKTLWLIHQTSRVRK